ncbi:ABC transporter ATP-binding protein [Fervidobacterium nodosum]|uniref:ABC transporter related n=1 Tax=Fervidobacterium nodosum (strain ATCC 35602 / DSM 5306 / Rt17-B1) TaxID=381764 RepID=A7HKF9_FERNB|nr:ABC transporter ATP-binding protein [Fervidobacterium nodosum]ABS60392.1 ABC transporter related [Fervidobacterium nodosum Rt17-B1]PHJ14589.1 ABC transporter ATP-binding protein [Fervidobacterium sp. SC_NGM5_G05]
MSKTLDNALDIQVKGLNVFYGPVHAVKGVNLTIEAGKITAIVGANGAGKTSTLKAIVGGVKSSGTVLLGDESINHLPVHERVRKGIVLCPEGRGIFYSLTVKENLLAGAYLNKKPDLDFVFDVFPFLKDRLNQIAGTLSGGEQQMLAIARALMANPRYLLLDEPSLGLAPIIIDKIVDVVKLINSRGITVVLVEQNTSVALSISHYGYVLENGRVALEGDAKQLLGSDLVREKYLGGVKK